MHVHTYMYVYICVCKFRFVTYYKFLKGNPATGPLKTLNTRHGTSLPGAFEQQLAFGCKCRARAAPAQAGGQPPCCLAQGLLYWLFKEDIDIEILYKYGCVEVDTNSCLVSM